MLKEELENLLEAVRSGQMAIEEALEKLKFLPFSDLGFAKVDHHRELRSGFPEVILCLGKTPAQVKKIVAALLRTRENILATKADKTMYKSIREVAPSAKYNAMAKIVFIKQTKKKLEGLILVISGGTADMPVAEEAAITAEVMGNEVERLYDVGVAGIHRLLAYQEKLFKARVIIVVAGMEGALASLVGGLVACPVIAVPTSIGYGASFQGLSALLGMLNSCASGLAVVNIDNGFGAGYMASLINKGVEKQEVFGA